MSKRTPGPLTAERDISERFDRDNAIVQSDAFCLTIYATVGHTADEQWANAQFIVRAWNAHDDLLEACVKAKDALHIATSDVPHIGDVDRIREARTKLDAAIAKATEVQS